MKKYKLMFLFLTTAVLLLSCQKEKSYDPDVIKQTKESKMVLQKTENGTVPADQLPFVIHSAGLYQGTIYLSISFTGGIETHQFTVIWDGSFISNGDKKEMDLIVYHPYVNDPGTSTVYDSISANILPLGICLEELNNPLLWIRVTNSLNPENTFFFKASNNYVDPVIIPNVRKVKVVKEGCSDLGLWGDLWLVSEDTVPAFHYFVMATDESVTYKPVEGDHLKINFDYTYITDSLNVCTQLKQLNAQPIKITKITK